jgi:hypothetical protein
MRHGNFHRIGFSGTVRRPANSAFFDRGFG